MANTAMITTACLLSVGSIFVAAQTAGRNDAANPDSSLKVLPFNIGGRDFYHNYVRKTLPVLFTGGNLKSSEASLDLLELQKQLNREKFSGFVYMNSGPSLARNTSLTLKDWVEESSSKQMTADLDISKSRLLEDIYLPVMLHCKEYRIEYNKLRLSITSEDFNCQPKQYSDEMLYISLGPRIKARLFDSRQTSQLIEEGFPKLEHQDVMLERGDILYVPKYWWSQVQATKNHSFGVKIFFNMAFSKRKNEKHQISKNVIEAIQLHKMQLEEQPGDTICSSNNQVLRQVLKINESDPKTLQLRIPRRPQRPDDVILASGYKMPVLGLGTALLNEKTTEIVKQALDLGYRLFDTAQGYPGSEAGIARAISESSVPRSELFIVTKLHPRYLGYASTLKAIDMSLRRLNIDYVDLFLIHSKECDDFLLKCSDGEPVGTWQESWAAMEDAQRQGKIRSLGVSNFNVPDLKTLRKIAKLPISVVQNWFDPIHQDTVVRKFCKQQNIRYMGYSTLGGMWTAMGLEENPILTSSLLTDLSTHYDYFVSSLVLRWAIHQNVTVIPRTTNRNHLAQNLRALDMNLSELDIGEINSMATILDDILKDLEDEEKEMGQQRNRSSSGTQGHENESFPEDSSGKIKMEAKDVEQNFKPKGTSGNSAPDDIPQEQSSRDESNQSSVEADGKAMTNSQSKSDETRHKSELK